MITLSEAPQYQAAQSIPARNLQSGMLIALRAGEFWFPFKVLDAPILGDDRVHVPVTRVGFSLRRLAPFNATSPVALLPSHFGICVRCGGLSPCIDEAIERDLEAAATRGAFDGAPVAHTGGPSKDPHLVDEAQDDEGS